MFCTKCGANLPDNSKFCNVCGAEQATPAAEPTPPVVETAPAQTEDTAQKPAKKKSPLIIAVALIAGFLIGYFVIAPAFTKDADKKDDKKDTTSSSQVVNDDAGALKYNKDNLSADAWKFDALGDSLEIEVAVRYCRDTDYITDITFSTNVNKNYELYSDFETAIKDFETRIKALNDSNILFSSFIEGDKLVMIAQFNNLCDSDRAERVKMASEVVGSTYDTSKTAFLYSSVKSELEAASFHK